MLLVFTILASISAAVAAFATFRIMLQGFEPAIMQDFVLHNPRSAPTLITRLYTKTGSFAELVRDARGKGYYSDTKKTEIPLNRILYSGQTYDLPWRYLFINGKQTPFTLRYHLDFWRSFSFHDYKVEAIPA